MCIYSFEDSILNLVNYSMSIWTADESNFLQGADFYCLKHLVFLKLSASIHGFGNSLEHPESRLRSEC